MTDDQSRPNPFHEGAPDFEEESDAQPIVTLLTDFGSDEHYVGVMKGVVMAVKPGGPHRRYFAFRQAVRREGRVVDPGFLGALFSARDDSRGGRGPGRGQQPEGNHGRHGKLLFRGAGQRPVLLRV